MEYVLALVVLGLLVGAFVLWPLRGGADADAGAEPAEQGRAARADDRRAELEAAKEAKLREIRDAELDHRMGKLSDADFARTDAELRGQAAAILDRLDALAGEPPAGPR